MSLLPDSNRFPHNIINEDRKQFAHPGYAEKNCIVCHKDFIVGAQVAPSVTNCGRKECDNRAMTGGTI